MSKTTVISASVVVDSPTIVNNYSLDIDEYAEEKLTQIIIGSVLRKKLVKPVKRFANHVNGYVYTAEMEIVIDEEEHSNKTR